MVELTARWVFALATLVLFGFGAILTMVSFLAYQRSGRQPAFRLSTVGFGLITIGSLAEPIYQFSFHDARLIGRELYLLQALEGTMVGIGLGLLFYSIYRYNTTTISEPEV